MLDFTSGCCASSHISEKQNYLTQEFRGKHHPCRHHRRHDRVIMTVRRSAPGVGGFKPYFISDGDSDKVESGMSIMILDFFTFCAIHSLPPHRRADGDQCVARRAAANVAFSIIRASVSTSPIMDELRPQGQQRCYERRALHGYSCLDLDSEGSVARLSRVLGSINIFWHL